MPNINRHRGNQTVRILIFGFLGEFCLLFLMGFVGYFAIHNIFQKFDEVINVQQKKLFHLVAMDSAIKKRIISLHNMILLKDELELNEEWERFGIYAGDFMLAHDLYTGMGLDIEEKTLAQELTLTIRSAEDNVNSVAALVSQGLREAAENRIIEAQSLNSSVLEVLYKIRQLQKEKSEIAVIAAGELQKNSLLGMIVSSFLILVMGVLFAIFIVRRVIQQYQLVGSLVVDLKSAKQALEHEVVVVRKQLQNQIKALATAKNDAVEANRSKSQFIADVSHELRTPMNAIIGYSELLMDLIEDGEVIDSVVDIRRIHKASNYLLDMLNDVLDLSKIESKKMELYIELIDISQVIEEVIATIKPLIKSNVINTKNIPQFKIKLDKMRVKQVLINLISNALKFTENGEVNITVNITEKKMFITIKDSGIGMSQEQLDTVFEDYAQAHRSTSQKYGGTGLGLAICLRLCQLMRGDLRLASKIDEGTIATVSLPLK